jgi:hypothetical protein
MGVEHLSRQHLVPRSFAKELHLNPKELRKHIVYIDSKVHSREDKYVPIVLQEVRRARKEEGIRLTIDDVLLFRNAGWFRG